MTSRLSSSAHWRSSNTSSVGRSMASMMRSAISCTSIRRDPSESAPAAALERQQVGAERPERRVLTHRAREVLDRGEGHESVVGGEIPLRHAIARGLGLAQHGVHHPGLADAGLPGQQQEVPAPGRGLDQAPVREREQVVAADEQRTQEGTHLAH